MMLPGASGVVDCVFVDVYRSIDIGLVTRSSPAPLCTDG